MYATFFRITQDPSRNPYLVTNWIPLSLWCTFVPFARNINGPFTTAALPTRRNVIENLVSLVFLFVVPFIVVANNTELSLITKEGGFIQIQLKVMSKTKTKKQGNFPATDPPTPPQSSCVNNIVVENKYVVVL